MPNSSFRLCGPHATERPRAPTLARALGLAATDRPAPTDAEVAQWLAARREEKYE